MTPKKLRTDFRGASAPCGKTAANAVSAGKTVLQKSSIYAILIYHNNAGSGGAAAFYARRYGSV